MTKTCDFPEGYDVPEFIEGCKAIWYKNVNPRKEIPVMKEINGISHRLYAWTEIGDTTFINKDLEVIKKYTGARHIACIKVHNKYQCVYVA